jgi:hypothetical protein
MSEVLDKIRSLVDNEEWPSFDIKDEPLRPCFNFVSEKTGENVWSMTVSEVKQIDQLMSEKLSDKAPRFHKIFEVEDVELRNIKILNAILALYFSAK